MEGRKRETLMSDTSIGCFLQAQGIEPATQARVLDWESNLRESGSILSGGQSDTPTTEHHRLSVHNAILPESVDTSVRPLVCSKFHT